MLSYEITS